MAICCPKSIRAHTLRICRLDACGVPLPADVPMSRIDTNAYMSLTISPDIEDGTVLEKKNGADDFCIQDYNCPRLKKLDLTLNVCGVPTHILEMLGGISLLTDNADIVGGLFPNANFNGIASPDNDLKGSIACGNGISMEFYTENSEGNGNCSDGSGLPFVSWVLPKTQNWIVTSDLVFTNDILEIEMEGIAFGNPNFEACGVDSPWVGYEQQVRDTNTPLGYICTDRCPTAGDCEYASA